MPTLVIGIIETTHAMIRWMLSALAITPLFSGCDHAPTATQHWWPIIQHCDLAHASCHNQGMMPWSQANEAHSAKVQLTLSPQPIPVAKPIQVNAHIEGLDKPDRIELDLEGLNMYMGFNRVTLNIDTYPNVSGQTMIAFCTEDHMQWQANLIFHYGQKQLVVPFHLSTSTQKR